MLVTSDVALEWDVVLPDRRRAASSGAQRPRSTLLVSTATHGEERISLPVAVGRALKAALDADEVHPTSRAELLFLVREQSVRCASLRAERLIGRRDYSAHELGEKLRLDGYAQQVREACVARAVECGLISDARYAAALIRAKRSSGWGRGRIEQELRRRGIGVASLPGWPGEYFEEDDERERALCVARARRIASEGGYDKLVRFLCGRGFTVSVAMQAAREAVDEATSTG